MAKLELTHHQAFPEDGDPGWHAGWMPDGRRVHATPIRCNPGEPHWTGSVEDPDRCECNGDGTCNLCLIRENDGLVFTRVTGCYRSANSAVRALQQWATNPDAPPPPAPFNCSWTTMQAVLCENVPNAPAMPLGTTENPMLPSQNDAPLPPAAHPDDFRLIDEVYEDHRHVWREIAMSQITPESLDECSESGHPQQAWMILSEKQKDAVTCPTCGRVPDFFGKSSGDSFVFAYDSISETLNETHMAIHDIFQEEITFVFQSHAFKCAEEWPKPGSTNLTRLPYLGDDAITLRWFRDEWNQRDTLPEDVQLLNPDNKEPLTEESLREFMAESHKEGFSYESSATDIINATRGIDDDDDDDGC